MNYQIHPEAQAEVEWAGESATTGTPSLATAPDDTIAPLAAVLANQ